MTSSLDIKVHNMHFVISLACFSFDTHFISCVHAKRGIMVPGIPHRDHGSWG